VKTEDDYSRVAAISANDDDAVGAVIAMPCSLVRRRLLTV